MHPILQERNLYLVKEHVGMFKAANEYDLYDPESGRVVLHCREPKLGTFTKLLRFTDYKRYTPFDLRVTTPEGEPVLRIERGVSFFLSKVRVYDDQDRHVGGFKQKLFSIGGRFDVLDEKDEHLCHLKGKWTGWNFKFVAGERMLAEVSKQWAGIGKEMFTSADTYVLHVDESVPSDFTVRELIVAAVLCIDMVLKE